MKYAVIIITVIVTLFTFYIGYQAGSSIWDNFQPKQEQTYSINKQ